MPMPFPLMLAPEDQLRGFSRCIGLLVSHSSTPNT